MNAEQVDKWGRLFARIMDKRDGTGTQEAVDQAVAALGLAASTPDEVDQGQVTE